MTLNVTYSSNIIDTSPIELPCGATAEFDAELGCSYRCSTCFTVVGSVSMPKECRTLMDMEIVVNKLSGKK